MDKRLERPVLGCVDPLGATKPEAAMEKSNSQSAWAAIREEARGCTRCSLHLCGTQTVFGEGPVDASLMLVGEQPGDSEDLEGRPFVDRKSVVEGKSVSVRVDLGGRRIIKKKK